MAKMLTPLLRKLPSLSSAKLMFRCKCEGESYTSKKRGCSAEKEYGISSDAEKECKFEKDCNCIPVQNTSTTSSTLENNNCDPIMKERGSEVPGAVSEGTADMLQCTCHQCQGTPLKASVPPGTPAKWINPPEVPTNCCMTGCPNCVWLKFAEDMMQFSKEGGADARKIIEEIEDQNLRTFLLLELDSMQKT